MPVLLEISALFTDRLDKYNPSSVINSIILYVYKELMYSCIG